MRIALFAHDDHNHIGIVTDFGMLDFSRAFQAQQLIQHGDESPQLITDMVALMKAGLFNAETFESTMMFVYEHHLNGAFTVTGSHPAHADSTAGQADRAGGETFPIPVRKTLMSRRSSSSRPLPSSGPASQSSSGGV